VRGFGRNRRIGLRFAPIVAARGPHTLGNLGAQQVDTCTC
jgi:hypothetical protein